MQQNSTSAHDLNGRSVLAITAIILMASTFLISSIGLAQSPPLDSRDSQQKPAEPNSLFNPTPAEKMREFNPDRPGSTNTPYTIDPGHVQLEIEIFNYSEISKDAPDSSTKTASSTTSQWTYPNPTIRIGLTSSTEIGIGYVPQLVQRVRISDGTEENKIGPGDTILTFKRNMLGNDGGAIAWAIMPSLKIPTDRSGTGNGSFEPGLMLPFSFTLDSWVLSIMPEIDVRKNTDGNSLHTELNSPITIGHNLFKSVDVYGELVTHTSNEDNSASTSFLGIGFVWKVSGNAQLDLGCNFGTNSSTPHLNPFAGWTTRF